MIASFLKILKSKEAAKSGNSYLLTLDEFPKEKNLFVKVNDNLKVTDYSVKCKKFIEQKNTNYFVEICVGQLYLWIKQDNKHWIRTFFDYDKFLKIC